MDYNIKWVNQGGIRESGMTKWIITLHNSDGKLVKKTENNERANLNNFSTVNVKLTLTRQEAIKQTATNNVIKVYYDDETDDTKLIQKTMSFDRSRLTIGLNDIEKIDYEFIVIPSTAKFEGVRGLPAKKFTNFIDHEYVHTQPAKFRDYDTTYDTIFIYRSDVEDTEGFIYFADDDWGIIYLDSPTFDPDNIRKVVFRYWRDWDGVIRDGPYDYVIEDKIDKEYWISVFIGRPYTLPEEVGPVVGDTFNCTVFPDKNYILDNENEMKWLRSHSDVKLTFTEKQDCGDYAYTGVKDKYETTVNSKCGPNNGNKKCPYGMCCSSHGWCGGENGKQSAWCHTEKWYRDRPATLWTWTKDNGWRWTNNYGQHFGGSHNFEYDGTNIDGSTIPVWWQDGSREWRWFRDDRKPKKGDIVRCRTNDPLGNDFNATYYYDGNNTLLYLQDKKVMHDIVRNTYTDWASVGDMVIPNCSGIRYGGIKDSV